MDIHQFADAGEQIKGTETHSGGVVSAITKAGRIRVKTINRNEAAMEETNLKVLLEITGAEIGRDRLGVNIVTVLDVTAGIDEKQNLQKLNELKIAMKFIIQKLSSIDRLSIVTFSRKSTIINSELLEMTENNKTKIEELVNDLRLVDESSENQMMEDDDILRIASRVVNDCKQIAESVPAIMLVSSNGEREFDATNIDANVPIYTFGLGPNYDHKVLNEIATKSKGGTFSISDVQNTATLNINYLSVAFLQCLAGILTVAVQDLKVTITTNNNNTPNSIIIHKVSAGNYSKTMINNNNNDNNNNNNNGVEDDDVNNKTLSFGNVYSNEKRRIMVELLLPAVQTQATMDVLQLTYSYKVGGEFFHESTPLLTTVTRTKMPKEQEKEEVTIEEARLRTVKAIEKAIEMANNGELDEAQDIIVEAQNMLEDDVDEPKESLEMLKYELYELIKLLQSKEMYKSLGHAFAIAIQTSHETQRASTRGDLMNSNQPIFATPLMNKFVAQSIAYHKNDSMVRLTSIVDDFEQEILNNPIVAFPGALSFHLEKVIQILKTMQEKLNRFR